MTATGHPAAAPTTTARSLLAAAAAPLGARAVGTALGFLVGVAIGRRLGDEGLGTYALGTGVMLLGASVARLGQDVELTRLVAGRRAGEGTTPWPEVAGILRVVMRAGIGIGGVGAVVAGFVGAADTVVIGFVAVPGAALVGCLAGVARGVDRATLGIALDATLVPLGTLPMVLLADSSAEAIAGHGLVWLAVAATGLAIVGRRSPSITVPALGGVVRAGAPLAGLAALNLALSTTDVVAVTILRGDAEAGHYAAAARLAFVSTSVLVVANAVLQPRIAALWAVHRPAELRRLMRVSTMLLAGTAAVVAGTLIAAAGPLLAVFGPEFDAAVDPLRILAVGQFVALASGPVGAVLLMSGHARRQLDAVVVAVVVNLVADLLLVPHHGVTGAAAATAAALTVKNVLSARWAWDLVGSRP